MEGRRRDNMNNSSSQYGFVYKFFKLFTIIHPGEALTTLLLALNIFFLLLSSYILKTIREGLILGFKGPVVKSYLYGVMAILFIFVIKIFSRLASRVSRHILITWVTIFFISNLLLFYIAILAGLPEATFSIIFYIWVGMFNVMVVAQFWAFANDIYSTEAGKRLFPLIMFGANFGAFSGGIISGWLIKPLGLYQMLLTAGGVLGICILLTWIIHKRGGISISKARNDDSEEPLEEKPLEKGGGFKLIFKSRYLLYIAFFLLLLNLVNSTGEFILGEVFTRTAVDAIRNGIAGGMSKPEFISTLWADFYSIVNLVTMLITLLLTSRIFKYFGIRGAIFFLPVIALGGYMMVSFGAALMVIRVAKIMENSTDYSIMNTTRQAFFLITPREIKYKAKTAIDTFFWRTGDALSTIIVFVGTTYLAFNMESFAKFNVVIAVIWIGLGVLIAKEHKKLSSKKALIPE
jgi:AAA family ATP:ADP antiporter